MERIQLINIMSRIRHKRNPRRRYGGLSHSNDPGYQILYPAYESFHSLHEMQGKVLSPIHEEHLLITTDAELALDEPYPDPHQFINHVQEHQNKM